jgi:hypothetical protein
MPQAARLGLTTKEYVWVASKSSVGEVDLNTEGTELPPTADEYPLGFFG